MNFHLDILDFAFGLFMAILAGAAVGGIIISKPTDRAINRIIQENEDRR